VERARVVLVTNVGQGFGRAVALSYGQAGYDVVCADTDVDLASKTAAEVEELGGQAIPVQADVSAQLDVRGAFAKVHEIFGALGGVVHVACQQSQTPFARLTDAEFAELLREDVTSTYLVLREAARHVALAPAWVVIVTPPRASERPQMAAVHGAITSMASAFFGSDGPLHPEAPELDDPGLAPAAAGRPRVNVVIPSRGPSDPRHDARLANTVRYLGSAASRGVSGTTITVELPPPPRLVETLLPEVQAALDDTTRQAEGDEQDEDAAAGGAGERRFDVEGGDDLDDDGDDLDGGDLDGDDLEEGGLDDDFGDQLEVDGLGDGLARHRDGLDDEGLDDDERALESEGLDDAGIDDAVRAIAAVEGDGGTSRSPFAPRRRAAGR
jgi:NAD(P)-dependent dehydrogenase (short-subunit alcohol dehydrogenase family)